MSKVLVKYRGYLASIAGVQEETCDARDVDELLKSLGKHRGRELEKKARAMMITHNGKNILLLKRYKTLLSEGDTVSFYPICAGG